MNEPTNLYALVATAYYIVKCWIIVKKNFEGVKFVPF